MLLSVLIANEAGIPVYSHQFSESKIEDTNILAFFSALSMFAKAFMKDNSGLESIRIGQVLMDFGSVDFVEIGHLDVIIISEGVDATSSHAVMDEITEKFAIFLDECRNEDPFIIKSMKEGRFPNLQRFDASLNQIIKSTSNAQSVPVNIQWELPIKTLNLVKKMFEMKPFMADTYEHNPVMLLEQILQEYTDKNLEKDLKSKFKHESPKK
jgi:hypothetical protein